MPEWKNLIVVWLVVGLIAGRLAGLSVTRYGLSIVRSLLVGLSGVVGGFVGFLYDIHIGNIGCRIIAAIIDATDRIQIAGGLIAAIINPLSRSSASNCLLACGIRACRMEIS